MKVLDWLDHEESAIPGLTAFVRTIALALLLLAGTLIAGFASCHHADQAELARMLHDIHVGDSIRTINERTVRVARARRDLELAEERSVAGEADRAAEAMRIAGAAARASTGRIHVRPDSTPPATVGDTTARVIVMRDGDSTRYTAPQFFADAMVDVQHAFDAAVAAQVKERDARLRAEAVIAQDSAVFVRYDTLLAGMHRDLAVRDSVIALERPPRCGRRCGAVIGVVGTLASAIAIDRVIGLARLLGGRR